MLVSRMGRRLEARQAGHLSAVRGDLFNRLPVDKHKSIESKYAVAGDVGSQSASYDDVADAALPITADEHEQVEQSARTSASGAGQQTDIAELESIGTVGAKRYQTSTAAKGSMCIQCSSSLQKIEFCRQAACLSKRMLWCLAIHSCEGQSTLRTKSDGTVAVGGMYFEGCLTEQNMVSEGPRGLNPSLRHLQGVHGTSLVVKMLLSNGTILHHSRGQGQRASLVHANLEFDRAYKDIIGKREWWTMEELSDSAANL
ncbi:hypothetical protein WJX79_004102 [Trebouxia sp. C0005]